MTATLSLSGRAVSDSAFKAMLKNELDELSGEEERLLVKSAITLIENRRYRAAAMALRAGHSKFEEYADKLEGK